MSSDSDTKLATQQSIKAYVDASSSVSGLSDTTISSAKDGDFLVYTGSAWVNETPSTARTSLGLGTAKKLLLVHLELLLVHLILKH